MADEMKKKVSNLTRAVEVEAGALFLVSNPDPSTESGYGSFAATPEVIAERLLGGIRYETELDTEAKTIFEAINEAAQTGGGGSGVDEFARAEIEKTNESLDLLWKFNKGISYDFVNKVERGLSVNPAGTYSKSLLDVRGESRQESTNGYQMIDVENVEYKNTATTVGYVSIAQKVFATSVPFIQGENYVISFFIKCDAESAFRLNRITIRKDSLTGEYISNISNRTDFTKEGARVSFQFTADVNSTDITAFTIQVYCSDATNTPTAIVSDVMIEKGSVGHNYEPYTGGVPSPSPDYPQEITPVEQINVSVDGVVRTITPPFALNGISDYYDFADIDKGVWVVNTGEYTFKGNENWLTASDGAKYVTYADELAGFRFGKNSVDGLYCLADKYGCEKFRTVRGSKYEALSVQLQPNYSRFWASPSVDISKVAGTNIILVRETPTETPIDSADLEFFRSLTNLDKSKSLLITDQNGKDISYLLEYIIKLSEVN